MRLRVASALAASLAFFLSACVSGSSDLGFTPSSDESQTNYQAAAFPPVSDQSLPDQASASPPALEQPFVDQTPDTNIALHSGTGLPDLEPYVAEPFAPPVPAPLRTSKTYLLNGLASAIPFIGYGFTNLSKKIPGSELYSYATPLEGSTVIRASVLRSIEAAYARDPHVEINLIGISYGTNVVTNIASVLHRKGIPVHYLAGVEGPLPRAIKANVEKADSFICTNLDCFRVPLRLASGNSQTQLSSFKVGMSHIPLGDSDELHNRVLQQIND